MPICYAINSKNNGQIFVRIQTGYNINELYDVQINSPADGQFLRYVTADGRWENRTANLSALSDVTVTTPVSGEVLRYNGTTWVDAKIGLNDITAVLIGTAATGEVLRYNGTNWVDARLASTDLSDSSSLPRIVSVPSTATSSGSAGQIAYDASFLYVCVATNTWRRVAIGTW
jgi:hypothetical protein